MLNTQKKDIMDKDGFTKWLLNKYEGSTVKSRVTNCERICEYEGDLDYLFQHDGGKKLLEKLTYSKKNEREKIEKKHEIPINGNIYNGTATFKQAAKLYFEFKSGNKIDFKYGKLQKKEKREWPVWETPSDDEVFNILRISTKYIKFLNPNIINEIVIDNRKNNKKWSELLIKNEIDPEIYLWDNSPCAFPGVRRYAGSKEIAFFRKHTEINKIEDALSLDDNDFPKHIWSYLFLGKKFPKNGPPKYSLAHLADHKEYNNRLFDEFLIDENIKIKKMFGLFTAPTNTVYIPSILIKPTDFSPEVRKVLILKANELYGNICNILPPWAKLKDNDNIKWNIKNFNWGEPVGDIKDIKRFLEFREELIDRSYLKKK